MRFPRCVARAPSCVTGPAGDGHGRGYRGARQAEPKVVRRVCVVLLGRAQLLTTAPCRRFIRVRDDKRPEDATTPDDIVHLYNKQTRKVVVGERGGGDVGRAAGAARPATGCGGAAAVQAQGAQGAGASKRSGRGRDSEDGSTDDGTMREDARKQAREVHGLDDDDHDEGEGQNECGKSKQVEL